jgi:hypothetical protein
MPTIRGNGRGDKKEDTGISARCLPEGRKCAVALAFQITHFILTLAKPFVNFRKMGFSINQSDRPLENL